MNKLFFPVLLSLSALMMLSCSDEATNSTQPPECENDECEQLPNDCQSCTLDAKKCDGDTLFTCQKKDDCTEWVEVETCNTGCNAETLSCNSCEDECTPDEKKCDGDALMSCQQSGGCAHWVEQEACEFGCNEDTLSCISCIDECQTDEKMCDGNAVLICKKEDAECTHWVVEETCPTGKLCSKNTCVDCEEICTKGDKKCDLDGVLECNPDANGCAEWNRIETCKSTDHCDESTHTCVAGCVDKCIENAKQCASDVTKGIQTCIKNDDDCLVWSDPVACDANKICTGEDPKCEYACGPEDSEGCKPFSIVILPDTQGYTLNNNYKNGSDSSCEHPCKGSECGHDLYQKQADWIVEHQSDYNVKIVLHMGDVANDNCDYQYELAQSVQKTFANANIPYTIATGNHEYKQGDSGKSAAARGRTHFGTYFNDKIIKEQFKGKDLSWFKGFHSTGSMYATFDVGNLKFAVIALEYAPRKDILCWADNLIQNELKDRYIILTTHAYLRTNNRSNSYGTTNKFGYFTGNTIRYNDSISNILAYTPYGASGDELYHELIARHSNVILISSGHHCDIAHTDRPGYLGNNIHETLVDYQCEPYSIPADPNNNKCSDTLAPGKGNGWLRILTIDPQKSDNNVVAKTLSPITTSNKYNQFYCPNYYQTAICQKENNVCTSKSETNDHNYTFTMNLTRPIQYQYSNNDDLAFGVRNINTIGDGSQFTPAVAVKKDDGSFVAVWDSDAKTYDGSGNHNIKARIFCAGGCSNNSEFAVNKTATGQHKNPDIAMDKDGNFVIVWADDSDDNGTYQIYARGFNADGSEAFPQMTVNSEAAGQQFTPAIAMAPNGNFVVAWEDQSESKTTPQVFIRGFDKTGKERFHDRNIMETTAGSRIAPDIAMDKDGNFVVAWQDDYDANGKYEVYARKFDANGVSTQEKVTVVNTDPAGNQLHPSISMNANGDFFIVYNDNNKQIKARGFDANNQQIFEDQIISDKDNIKADQRPVVCVADDGSAVVGWTALNQGNDKTFDDKKGLKGHDIHRGLIQIKDGKYVYTVDSKATHNVTIGDQTSPAVDCASNGQHVFVFSDDDDLNKYTEIFGRGYNSIN